MYGQKNLGGGGMIALGGILNLLFAAVYDLTYTPSTGLFAQPTPITVLPIFTITGLIFLAAGIIAYKGIKTRIVGTIAILVALAQIVWLYLSGIIFMSGLLSYGFIFGIVGGIFLLRSKA